MTDEPLVAEIRALAAQLPQDQLAGALVGLARTCTAQATSLAMTSQAGAKIVAAAKARQTQEVLRIATGLATGSPMPFDGLTHLRNILREVVQP